MRKLTTITIISTIALLGIFAPISCFHSNVKEDNGRKFSPYATDGKIDTTKYTEEDIEMSFY